MLSYRYSGSRVRERQHHRCRTVFQLTAEEASQFPDAERIDGTMLLREVDDDEDTEPGVFRSEVKDARI